MKALQKFSTQYLEECKKLSPEEIVRFLENFRLLNGEQQNIKSKLISIKIPQNLLDAFKTKAAIHSVLYQTQIKKLMKDWVET